MTKSELSCLQYMAEYGGRDYFFNFITIMSHVDLTRAQVKRAVRSLARKGLAEFRSGLMTEDGEVAGSGYGATTEGRNFIINMRDS